jgi:hypothetical protein
VGAVGRRGKVGRQDGAGVRGGKQLEVEVRFGVLEAWVEQREVGLCLKRRGKIWDSVAENINVYLGASLGAAPNCALYWSPSGFLSY